MNNQRDFELKIKRKQEMIESLLKQIKLNESSVKDEEEQNRNVDIQAVFPDDISFRDKSDQIFSCEQ